MFTPKPLLVVLMGPTASGKTDLSLLLAHHYNTAVVNADARQVYRGLDIGTGKVTPAQQTEVPHHLLNVVPIGSPFNAGEFVRLAHLALEDIFARQPIALLVGGTFFYVKALLHGLPDLPPTDAELRQTLNDRFATEGLEPLLAELHAADPIAYQTIDRDNPRRVLRALEVIRLTGQPYSSFNPKQIAPPELPFRVLKISLEVEPETLKLRIAQRVDTMLAGGWLAEVEGLLQAGMGPALQTVDAIGYRELAAVVQGELTLPKARERIITLTQQYARRQRTWLRSEPDLIPHRPELGPEPVINRIDALLRSEA